MALKFLAPGFYLNPFTGSVAPAQEWENDFYDGLANKDFLDQLRDDTGKPLSQLTIEDIWEYWGGSSLIEVEKISENE